jgi:hypothetical protein
MVLWAKLKNKNVNNKNVNKLDNQLPKQEWGGQMVTLIFSSAL